MSTKEAKPDPAGLLDGRVRPIYMSSRRTVMSGEVVTFATDFEAWDSAFGKAYRAKGPFEVSASRDAVVVHEAVCRNLSDVAALNNALDFAEQARAALEPHWRGGHPSMYPDEPTLCVLPNSELTGERPEGSRKSGRTPG